MKYAFLFFMLSFLLFSCKKKEIPNPTTENPVFRFRGTIGGDSVNYIAGIDRMYMYTGYFKDPQNLMTIKSYFGKDSCTNCEPYLSFEVKDFEASSNPGLAGTITEFLKSGVFYSYSLDSILTSTFIEIFNFVPSITNPGISYSWNFGDGSVSNVASPSHIFTGGGIKNVSLRTQYLGSTDSLINAINTDVNSDCRVQFNLVTDSLQTVAGVNVVSPLPAFTYNWNFGNSQTATGSTASMNYLLPSIYTVNLTATKAGCSVQYKQKANFTNTASSVPNFNYFTTLDSATTLVPRVNKSAFIITWRKDGKEYLSYKKLGKIDQSGNPVFTFIGVMPYKNNQNGDKSVLISGNVDTYLYNASNPNDSIKIVSKEIILAAAYPD